MSLEFFSFDSHSPIQISPDIAKELSCKVVKSVNYSMRCSYSKVIHYCQTQQSYVNYKTLFFCSFDPRSESMEFFYVLCLLVLCFIIFMTLAAILNYSFVPALKVICKVCSINEHLAGVTIVAFGSSAPAFIAMFIAIIHDSDQHELFSDIFASNLFQIMFIGGIIIVISPFNMHPTNAIRDAAFVLLTTLYIDFAVRSKECISIFESTVILSIYVLYAAVIVIDQILLQRELKRTEKRLTEMVERRTEDDFIALENLREEANFEVFATEKRSTFRRRSFRLTVDISLNRMSMVNPEGKNNSGLFRQFFESLSPFDRKDFRQASIIKKAFLIVNIPIKLIVLIILPVINYEMPRHGWSKLLNCIQIVSLPFFISFVISRKKIIFEFPVWPIPVLVTIPIAITVFYLTRTDVPPKGHFLLAFPSVIGGAICLYICDAEVMSMFETIGIVLNRTDDFLVVTLIAWGMSFSDLLENVSIALNGYERMGYSACYGTVMFCSVSIVGCTFLYKNIYGDEECYMIVRSIMDENCCCFLVLGLFFIITFLLLLNCNARRCVGFFSIGVYILFVIYTLLGELDIIHTYSGDQVFFPII